MSRRAPHVASIPPGVPFLPALVEGLLNGSLIEGFAPKDDALALSTATIWVPTRRAARALATEFVARMNTESALLPTIKALGDMDDDSLFFDDAPVLPLEETVSGLQRQLTLAQLIAKWAESLNDAQREIYQGSEILVPASFADATWFAQDLAGLMDMVATEEADWAKLDGLVPDDHANWWQLTLKFLQIATSAWPQMLQAQGKVDSASLRARYLRAQGDIYARGSAGPVIAAGSTGSIPATAHLLKTIAHMDNGMVVLPGLDRTMTSEVWQGVDVPDNEHDDSGTAPGHPQYGLKRLIDDIGILREDVIHLSGVDEAGTGYARVREQLISDAMLPSDHTGQWQEVSERFSEDQRQAAFENVSLIEARGEREEALAIALVLREKMEVKDQTAALVTPDRNLARRVAVELRRFGLKVDDSAGQPLRNRAHGTFARLVLNVGFGDMDVISLVSLLKHPLAGFGGTPVKTRHAARVLELAILRGALVPVSAGEFAHRLEQAVANLNNDEHRTPPALRKLSEEDWQQAKWLAQQLDEIFTSQQTTPQSFASHAMRAISLIEACGAEEGGSLTSLYGNEEGRALNQFLAELAEQDQAIELSQSEWPDIVDALMAGRVVRPSGSAHPRISILGPLEARLQTFDRIVLGGLNEKTWPAAATNDPFLSRPMKSKLGLPPPERRTGLAAHDFQVLLGMEDVFITRASRLDNAPTIASRWVQRLLMVAGDQAAKKMRLRGRKILDWVAQIDLTNDAPKPAPQPRPTPPVSARPKGLSITEIETWVKDPYEIYAKHVLGLAPLEPLIRQADARERGTLYHAIFEEFVRHHFKSTGDEGAARLRQLADLHFAESVIPLEIAALWRPRFETIIIPFMKWHDAQLQRVKKAMVEIKASHKFADHDFTLRGRADRLDVLNDGTLSIIDFKTGSNPSAKNVADLNAPQLPLEAALARFGAFEGLPAIETADLIYVRLLADDKFNADYVGGGKKTPDAADLAREVWKKLQQMIVAYENPNQPYQSKARQAKAGDREGDFDHLARVYEWSLAQGGDT